MFKGGNKVNHDALWVNYVKESSMFGAQRRDGQRRHLQPRIISPSITSLVALAVRARLPASSRARGGDGGGRRRTPAVNVRRALKNLF